MIPIICEDAGGKPIHLEDFDEVTVGSVVSVNSNRARCISGGCNVKYFQMHQGTNKGRTLMIGRYAPYEIKDGGFVFNN